MRPVVASTLLLVWLVSCVVVGHAQAQTVRASVAANGAQALGGSWVTDAQVAVSNDGRIVAFNSPADGLVAGDTDGRSDVFVSVDGAISRALPAGAAPDGPSTWPALSADGRFVAFASTARNLIPGGTTNQENVYIFDRVSGALTLVSVGPDGNPIGGGSANRPAISPNGRYVAFVGTGNELAPAPGPIPPYRVFRRDLNSAQTISVLVPLNPVLVSQGFVQGGVAVSDTGDVAFTYCGNDLVPGDTNGMCDAFVHAPDTGTTTRVSHWASGGPGSVADFDRIAISADGTRVAFTGRSLPFAEQAIVVYDRPSSTGIVVSRPLPGQIANGASRAATLSHDGRFVTFYSTATNLSPQSSGTLGLFRADLRALTIVGGVEPVTLSASARARAGASNAAVTASGAVVFVSDADDLVAGDMNQHTDLFEAPRGGAVRMIAVTGSAGRSARPALNYDGNVVAFMSTASNLVPGDDNLVADVFVKDMRSGQVERMVPGDEHPLSDAEWVALSDDGRYVAWNQSSAAWLYDRVIGTRTYVGRTFSSTRSTWVGDARIGISGDGRYVVFATINAYVPEDTNGNVDVYLFDRVDGRRRRISARMDGRPLSNPAYAPSISGDGRLVSFLSRDFESAGTSYDRPFILDRDADGDGIFDEVQQGATQISVRHPFFGTALATGASLSRDGRRLLHAAVEPFTGTLFTTDAPAIDGAGPGPSYVASEQPLSTFPRWPNVPMPSASGRLFVRVSNRVYSGAVRPYVLLEGLGTLDEDLSRTPAGTACTGGAELSTANPVISGNGQVAAFESGCVDIVSGDTNAMVDVFVTPTGWKDQVEPAVGYRTWAAGHELDPDQALGSPWTDADGDGLTNLAEFTSEPQGLPTLGLVQRHFAEGATTTPLLPFTTRIALANPGADPVPVRIEYALGSGTAPSTELTLAPWQRTTIIANEQPGLSAAEFGFRVLSTRPIGVDRTMTWDAGTYAAHSDGGAPRAALTWYFAEGATIAGFQLFYLLQNPSAVAAAEVEARYLLAGGQVVTRQYTVAPGSRFNIWANEEGTAGQKPLANQEVSAEFRVRNGVPIVAERAMYRDIGGRLFKAGHESTGVIAPATEWFLAEGNAGDFFDFFVLVANPSALPGRVQVDYLLASGNVVTRTMTIAANSRTTIWVDELEHPAGSGLFPFRTGGTDISVRVRSLDGIGIVVERAMWWPGQGSTWREAHNSAGATATASRWIVAEGEVSDAPPLVPGAPPPPDTGGWDTYVLVANTGALAGTIKLTLLVEGLVAPIVVSTTPMAASSRVTFSLRDLLGAALIPKGRAAVIVESVGSDLPLVVERAMYLSRRGQLFDAGMNALATPLPQ